MRITDEMNYLQSLVDLDKEMLIHQIYESWQKWDLKISTPEDRFVLGLRYSEFLANGSHDEDYVGAERRRGIYLGRLGVTREYINDTLKQIYGLS